MAGVSNEEEEEQFFDTCEEISYVSDRDSDCSEGCSSSVEHLADSVLCYSQSEIWTGYPQSVNERRSKFLKLMGFILDQSLMNAEDLEDESRVRTQLDVDRITENSGAVLRTSGFGDDIHFSQSSISSKLCEAPEVLEHFTLKDHAACRIDDWGKGADLVVSDNDQDEIEIESRLQESGSSQSVSFDEFLGTPGSSSSFVQPLPSRQDEESRDLVDAKRKVKRGWLKKLGAMARIIDRHGSATLKPGDHELTLGQRMRRVRVHPVKKQSRELSSLYTGQEFLAHEGSILTMKFSLDGQYLASGGEDGTVRVWKVIEHERLDGFDVQDTDPSCLYFTINHLSQLIPIDVDKEKIDKTKSLRKSSDLTCVVLPPKVFRLLEKPLHEFQGHSSEVLDLSWSKNGFLLSSSADKTVRLWQVGIDRCLRVFSHNNYVTSVAFNPVDDNYFISGSIDGKVRIWEVRRCQVVDYTDIREIVSAVCYCPDGKGGIVGTMTGNCRFYDIKDNQLYQQKQICLQGKKKLPGKRITGFQFSPSDPSKVIVTSADSLVRVLCGENVVGKFKASAFRVAGSQMFATFTSDGKHVVSPSEDSNIYIWNYSNQDKSSSRSKSIWSCESFLSHNVSVAIPWVGLETTAGALPSPTFGEKMQRNSLKQNNHQNLEGDLDQNMPHSPSDCFSHARDFFLEYMTKSAATWPEEKLPNASPPKAVSLSPLCKSKLKLLKSACQSILSNPHLWGLVIVTASWDGRIRTYLNYGLPIRI
ncbi:hypothetical protein KPL71_006262 [Citrus sinensis]|uniref:Uncharacterized protein n=1 Tax=Citrus sinensis TaxID=2711 RepID=A0ACB8LNS4_CITSI|nr:hypothetical protein KPL71_006262 [Citrus sinensis]